MEKEAVEHALMVRIARRDIVAYRELVNGYLHFCVRFAERMLGNRQDAEDITQEVCLKIWHEAPRWRPEAKFSTWLYKVMFNACIDQKRKMVQYAQIDLEEIIDNRIAADDAIIREQRSLRVKAALQELAPRQRAALIMSYYEELSNQQAAEVMEMQLGAFQQLLFRARQNLKECLLSAKVMETENDE